MKPGHLKVPPYLNVSGNGSGGALNLEEISAKPSPPPVVPTASILAPCNVGIDGERPPIELIEDPDFDPDNVVIRRTPSEIDEEEDANATFGGDKGIGGDITIASTNGFAIAPQQLGYSPT